MIYSITPTDYTGMDSSTLASYKLQMEQFVDMCEREIKRTELNIKALKKEIKENQNTIALAQAELLKIREADKSANEVKYITTVVVRKCKKSTFIGTSPVAYYSPSLWKDNVVYYFEVYYVNALGWDKGHRIVANSNEFTADEKGSFTDSLLNAISRYNAQKVLVSKGTRVNTSLLKKTFKDLVVEEVDYIY